MLKPKCLSAHDNGAPPVPMVVLHLVLTFLLIVPSSGVAAGPAWQSTSSDNQSRLSAAFTGSATSALIAIHQAKQNIANVVTKNLPLGYYDPKLAAQAYDQVRQSQIAAKTNGDQQAATLLNSYFTKVRTWAEGYKAARQSMNATDTMGGSEMLAQDSDWQAIESCEKAFNTMLVNRIYTELSACE